MFISDDERIRHNANGLFGIHEKEHIEAADTLLLRAIVDHINGGVSAAVLEEDKVTYLFVNDGYYELFGYTKEQFEQELPRGVLDLIHPDDLERVIETVRNAERTGESFSIEYRAKRRDGSLTWIRRKGSICYLGEQDTPVQLAVSYDIMLEKEREINMRRRAETDGMTGLLNKTTTELLIRERIASIGGIPCALVIADIDNLKSINDVFGHSQGDEAILAISEILHAQFRQTDIIGRFGGDEFVIFLDGGGSRERLCIRVSEMIAKLTSTHFGEDDDIVLNCSVGIVIGETGRDSFESLFMKADKALYHVKRTGKNSFAFYTDDMG